MKLRHCGTSLLLARNYCPHRSYKMSSLATRPISALSRVRYVFKCSSNANPFHRLSVSIYDCTFARESYLNPSSERWLSSFTSRSEETNNRDRNALSNANASDPFSGLKWTHIESPLSAKQYLDVGIELSKPKLSALVAMTTVIGYVVSPCDFNLLTLGLTSIGTGLCIASANTINQALEAPFDAQMKRTRNRPAVRGAIDPAEAMIMGLGFGCVGTITLWAGVSPLVAGLGFANIVLYTGIYTPSKRTTILNTWYGSIVGAIPPMMGWAAGTGTLDVGAWLLGAVLFAWQFPHFNALSWNLREDYSQAGYRMMSVTDPVLCRRVALQYSLAMFPICMAASLLEITTMPFAFTSTAINSCMAYAGWKFYEDANQQTARKLFMASIVHLPLLLLLFVLHKKQREDMEHWCAPLVKNIARAHAEIFGPLLKSENDNKKSVD